MPPHQASCFDVRALLGNVRMGLGGGQMMHVRGNYAVRDFANIHDMPDSAAPPDGRPRCYIASPLGFTEAGRWYYAEVFLPAIATVVEPLDPWASYADGVPSSEPLDRETAYAIGARNAAAIRSATLLAAHLDGQEVDSGTAAEIGFAAALRIPCFGLRSDGRTAGEVGLEVNLQVEAFIGCSGGRIVHSLDELIGALAAARVRATA